VHANSCPKHSTCAVSCIAVPCYAMLCCAVLCSQVVFEGTLHITDRHCCFQAKDQQQQQPAAGSSGGGSTAAKRPPVAFKISHSDVESATREPNPRRTLAASDLLQVVVNPAGTDSSSGLAPGRAGQAGLSGGGAAGRGLAPAVHKVAVQGPSSGTAAAAATTGPCAVGSSGGAGGGRWAVMFQQFNPSSGLDGALALIEHLRGGD
jgi:hypothetical protein